MRKAKSQLDEVIADQTMPAGVAQRAVGAEGFVHNIPLHKHIRVALTVTT